jgi:hypothetical protein
MLFYLILIINFLFNFLVVSINNLVDIAILVYSFIVTKILALIPKLKSKPVMNREPSSANSRTFPSTM